MDVTYASCFFCSLSDSALPYLITVKMERQIGPSQRITLRQFYNYINQFEKYIMCFASNNTFILATATLTAVFQVKGDEQGITKLLDKVLGVLAARICRHDAT